MPKLPEVETTPRGIAPHIINQTVAAVTLRKPKLRWKISLALPEACTYQNVIPSMRPKNDRLAYEILSAVAEIPFGKVATYGQIARLIGRDKNARLVGNVLRHAKSYGDYPCHRVVNAAGRLAPHWAAQADLLRSEGVEVTESRRVCLQRYRWDC
ncbi:MGMT family protein [Kingella potus]